MRLRRILILSLFLLPFNTLMLHSARRIQLVDINLALADQFAALPGVGNKVAEAIVQYRQKNGFFSSIESLLVIKELDQETFNAIKPYLTITDKEELKWEEHYDRIQENLEDATESGEYYDDIQDIDTLEALRLNPLNINTATKSQLMQLPYMSIELALKIIEYRKINRGFRYVDELRRIVGSDVFSNISPYVAVFRKGQEEKVRADLALKYNMREYPLSAGYLASDPKFHNPAEIYGRLRVYGGNRVETGLVFRRDDGSVDMSYYNFINHQLMKKYLLLRNTLFWDTLILGDYELSFGQGLVMYTASSWSSMPKKPKGIQGDKEDDNNDKFYGIAALREYSNLEVYAFYSNKSLIADRLNSDGSVGDNIDDVFGNKTLSYYELETYGYDRFKNSDYFNARLYGGRVKYFVSSKFALGSLFYQEDFNKLIDPSDSSGDYESWPYLFRGDQLKIVSADTEFSYNDLKQYVTIAKCYSDIFERDQDSNDDSRAWTEKTDIAWDSLTTIKIKKFKLWFDYHYIGPRYYAFHNKPLNSIYAQARNEEGQQLGIDYSADSLNTSFIIKNGRFIVRDKYASEEQDNELRITTKLRYKPSKTIELYLYNSQTLERKEEFYNSSAKSFIDDDNLFTYYTDYRKIQLAYKPSEVAYLKCGFQISEALYRELELYSDDADSESPKYTIYTDIKYKISHALTLYNKFSYRYTAAGFSDIYWSLNPKMNLSRRAKLYLSYNYNLTSPEHIFRTQLNMSWK